MKANYKLLNPDEMLAHMEIVMTVAEWRDLRKSLENNYAGNRFSSMITSLIRKAEESFNEQGETNGY